VESKVITEREIAATYGLTVAWLRRARRENRGPRYLKISRMVRYCRRDVEIFLAEHSVETRGTRIKKVGVAAKDAR